MKRIILALLVLGFIGAGTGFYLYNKPVESLKKAKPDFNLSAEELFSAFDTNEATSNEKYLDKIIELTGEIREINKESTEKLSITLNSGSEMFGVICELDQSQFEKSETFQVGQKISIKGQCTGMLMDVVLVRCILL